MKNKQWDFLDDFRKKSRQDTDPEKYLKFEKFKESIKNILNTKEDIYITIYPYKYDTIEKQKTYDEDWRGIKYTGYWDMRVKGAVFNYVDSVEPLDNESVKEFYENIKNYKSLDELIGNDFDLVPNSDYGADRENIKIDWDRPLTDEENKSFEEYGGIEQLVQDSDKYDNEDVIIGRISSIEISVGDKENFKIEIL